MKINLKIIAELQEIMVNIMAPSVTEEVENLIDYIENNEETIVGYEKNTRVKIIKKVDVVRIYIEDKKIYAETKEETYQLKNRLYQLEESMDDNFIKISQSELANIKFIDKLDVSMKGTILINYKNGSSSYVSRRQLKVFKEKLKI